MFTGRGLLHGVRSKDDLICNLRNVQLDTFSKEDETSVQRNLSKEWKQWRQVWDAYEEVTDLRNRTSRLRVATFITCIGKEALEVHNGLPFQSEDEKTDINKVLELWQNHGLGKTNIINERYKFNNHSQEQAESIDTYITSLRALAETCEFGALKEDLLRDQIVCGVRDKGIRRK